MRTEDRTNTERNPEHGACKKTCTERIAELAAALKLPCVNDEKRQEMIEQLISAIDDLDAENAETAALIERSRWKLKQDTAIRASSAQLLEQLQGGSGKRLYVFGLEGVKLTIVEAIDYILTESKAAVDRKGILSQLEALHGAGNIKKVPTDASLRAMLSQYAEGREWMREPGGMHFKQQPEAPQAQAESDVPF